MLSVRNYSVGFPNAGGISWVLEGIDLEIQRGDTFAFVGESGSGKTVTCLGIAQLLNGNHCFKGKILFDGIDTTHASDARLNEIRGRRIGFVFQDPASRLDPRHTVRTHLLTTIEHNTVFKGAAALSRAKQLLSEVGLPTTPEILSKYPHQLSGGMAQRVIIALALAGDPDLLIADEPVTALDVATKVRVLALLKRLVAQRGLTLIFVTHDLSAAAAICDNVAVFYAGQIVETAKLAGEFGNLRHPYSRALLRSVPRIGDATPPTPIPGDMPEPNSRGNGCRFMSRCDLAAEVCRTTLDLRHAGTGAVLCHFPLDRGEGGGQPRVGGRSPARSHTTRVPLLEVVDVTKTFGGRSTIPFLAKRKIRVVNDVSLTIGRGECLALVGESGSGKSTICRMIMGIETPSSGSIRLNLPNSGGRGDPSRLAAQMIFQDARAVFDQRLSVRQSIAEPLRVNRIGTAKEQHMAVDRMLELVHLSRALAEAVPNELSGGQLQRAAIARALILDPALLICDEPTSALDVSVQAQIITLLSSLKQQLELSLLFVSHDIALACSIADRMAVLLRGEIVESGPVAQVIVVPKHDYTRNFVRLVKQLDAPGKAASVAQTDAGDAGLRLASMGVY